MRHYISFCLVFISPTDSSNEIKETDALTISYCKNFLDDLFLIGEKCKKKIIDNFSCKTSERQSTYACTAVMARDLLVEKIL